MNSIEKDFSDRIFSLIPRQSKVVVAFSGGCDSLGLLLLCTRVFETQNIVAVYVNHNLRGPAELESEIELNCYNCDRLHVNLTVREIPRFKVDDYANENRISTEAAARILRYEILEEERVKSGSDFILTAHHFDDQIETVFMKKLQNSPITSLRGISDKNGVVVRPLLPFKKALIADYVRQSGFDWSTDSTNSDNSILRNKLRNEIIPEKIKENPDFEDSLISLRNSVVESCKSAEKTENPEIYSMSNPFVSIDRLNSLNEAAKLVELFSLWDRTVGSSRGLSKALIDRVKKECDSWNGQPRTVESNGGCFELFEGKLYLVSKAQDSIYADYEHELDFTDISTDISVGKAAIDGVSHEIRLPDGSLLVYGNNLEFEAKTTDLIMDTGLFKGKTVLRYVRQGDRINLKGGSKTVLRLLQDLKVPSSLRYRVPVIADETGVCAVFASCFDSRNRIDARFCDRSGTRFILLTCRYNA